jgi:uncharacterized protein (DUF302 family)
MMKNISNTYISDKSIEQIIDELNEQLAPEGFKIIQDLNIAEIMRENVDPDFDDYRIIGVCNPKLSHELLSQDKSIGLFLPCKVALYRQNQKTKIELQRPVWISTLFYSKHIESVTARVEEILSNILEKLA